MRPPIISMLVSMLVLCGTVSGQEAAALYPSKSVLLIDAQAAGGPADREARLYAKKMSGYLGQNFIIDSKPGAGTTIASAFVAKAKPNLNYKAWLGFVAPAATPPAIITKLNEAMVRAAKEPDVAGALKSEGSIIIASTPAQFRQFLVTDTHRNRKLMQDNGIKLSE